AHEPVVRERHPALLLAYHRPMTHSAQRGGATPTHADTPTHPIHAANLLGLDFAAEAARLPAPPAGIIDVHSHINGPAAAVVYRRAAELYGVRRVYSMTHLEKVDAVRAVLGDMLRLIAVPNFSAQDRRFSHG